MSFRGYIRVLYNHTIQNIASLMYTGSELYIIKLYIMIYTEWCLITRRFLVWIPWEASSFSVWSLHVLPVPVWDISFHRRKTHLEESWTEIVLNGWEQEWLFVLLYWRSGAYSASPEVSWDIVQPTQLHPWPQKGIAAETWMDGFIMRSFDIKVRNTTTKKKTPPKKKKMKWKERKGKVYHVNDICIYHVYIHYRSVMAL